MGSFESVKKEVNDFDLRELRDGVAVHIERNATCMKNKQKRKHDQTSVRDIDVLKHRTSSFIREDQHGCKRL